jgi:hypothetical protein
LQLTPLWLQYNLKEARECLSRDKEVMQITNCLQTVRILIIEQILFKGTFESRSITHIEDGFILLARKKAEHKPITPPPAIITS